MNLYIFSEDLRIRDNKALYEASLEQKGLIALYIINKGKNEEHGDSLAKLKLKLLALAEIRNPLVSLSIPIKILHSQDIRDEPKEILEISTIHTHLLFWPRMSRPSTVSSSMSSFPPGSLRAARCTAAAPAAKGRMLFARGVLS